MVNYFTLFNFEIKQNLKVKNKWFLYSFKHNIKSKSNYLIHDNYHKGWCFSYTLSFFNFVFQPVSHIDPVYPGTQPRHVPSTTSHRPSKQFWWQGVEQLSP